MTALHIPLPGEAVLVERAHSRSLGHVESPLNSATDSLCDLESSTLLLFVVFRPIFFELTTQSLTCLDGALLGDIFLSPFQPVPCENQPGRDSRHSRQHTPLRESMSGRWGHSQTEAAGVCVHVFCTGTEALLTWLS